ncbi:MAG: 7-cyano-7-deazaguanine synthase QueC [Candidatus Eremiobacteraeota bacterium]|nr:7-cyano-7-deazaguanine synthase QueC [Candidatus Eremiobacteraeota bacterium]
MMKKAVILSSGGLDSTTCAAIAKNEGFELYHISFDYGQRLRVELERAKAVALHFQVRHHLIITVNMRDIGGSALTSDIPVPKHRDAGTMTSSIPDTYVPARNTIFLSFALGWAEVIGAEDIFIGVNSIDYSGYPDCRPEYIEAFERMANLSTKAAVTGAMRFRIRTPLVNMTKKEIIQTGIALGVDYSITHSCYDPDPEGRACGFCDSCQLRLNGFAGAGLSDPVRYVEKGY